MTYQVKVYRAGEVIKSFDGIEAINALEAINRIESTYKSQSLRLDDETIVNWTGLEFQARRLDMWLS